MTDAIILWVLTNVFGIVIASGSSLLAVIVTFVLKKIPTQDIRNSLYKVFYKLGQKTNDFFKTWKFTKAIWSNVLEPWVKGFIQIVFVTIPEAFIAGMSYDDEKEINTKQEI